MNKHQLRSIIKKTIVGKLQRQGINKYKEYKVLNHVPDLISILTDLMSPQFNLFVIILNNKNLRGTPCKAKHPNIKKYKYLY